MMEHDHSTQATTTRATQRSTGGAYQTDLTTPAVPHPETDE